MHPLHPLTLVAVLLLYLSVPSLSAPLNAQAPPPAATPADTLDRMGDTTSVLALPGITVTAATPRTAASAATFGAERILLQAASTSGDILRLIPGMQVAQHGGGGKADQYLIRGFDADHGTDFALFVDGIPVNMVSHAHGQGYADLGHVIPETVREVEVYKGPYFPEYGNLSTAGTSEIRLRDDFDQSFVQVEGGSFGTARGLAVWSPEVRGQRGYIAAAASTTDGPFTDAQDFRRINATARWTVGQESPLTLTASAYDAQWNASGQIPLRAVESDRIGRFDAIDPTEGGTTRRLDASLAWTTEVAGTAVRLMGWTSRYELDLFSNFTFQLNDPVDGDGIVQRDRRTLGGGRLRLARENPLGVLGGGIDLRVDDARVLLGAQTARVEGQRTVDSDLRERNLGLWLQQEVEFDRWGRLLLGVRHDRISWNVEDRLGGGPLGREARAITLPKASLILTPTGSEDLGLFLNYGRGFHGNDARSVVSDPTGTALAAADGWEVGALKRFGDQFEITAAWWRLDLEGELVWVGDEGVTELSGPTRREGPELDVTFRPTDGVWLEGGFTHSDGRFRNSDDIIARAPRWTWRAGLGWDQETIGSGAVKLRGLADIPIEETGTAMGDGMNVVDVTARRALLPGIDVGIEIENLFDSRVKEAQTWFASRLPGESAGIDDNHFTPGYPRTLRLSVRVAR